jgi:hypothetical protein
VKTTSILLALPTIVASAFAGAFTNLGFDSPDLTHLDSLLQTPTSEVSAGVQKET